MIVNFGRDINNHCFRKSRYLDTHGDFQFILEESLLSKSAEDIPKNLEKLVKSEGFLADREMDVHSNITVTCLGNDEWVFANDEIFK